MDRADIPYGTLTMFLLSFCSSHKHARHACEARYIAFLKKPLQMCNSPLCMGQPGRNRAWWFVYRKKGLRRP